MTLKLNQKQIGKFNSFSKDELLSFNKMIKELEYFNYNAEILIKKVENLFKLKESLEYSLTINQYLESLIQLTYVRFQKEIKEIDCLFDKVMYMLK